MDFNLLWIAAALVTFTGAVLGIGMWVGAVNADRKSFRALMQEIRQKLDSMFERLPPPRAVQGSGPARLTEFGVRISRAASIREWAAGHARNLLDGAGGREEFDVFELCGDYVTQRLEKDEALRRAMRKVAYDFGSEVEQIRKVYEVELRDCVLAQRSS